MAEMSQYPFSRIPWLSIAASLLLLLSACGQGDGQGLDTDGNLLINSALPNPGGTGGGGSTGTGDPSGNPNATLDWVQSNVLTPICAVCHTGGATLELDWDSESSTCSNLGRVPVGNGSLKEIDSGNPDGSYVIWKIEGQGPAGEDIAGGRMPLGGDPLPAEMIQNFRDWISDGTPGCAGSRPAPGSVGDGPGLSVYPEGSWMYVWEQTLQQCSTCHGLEPTSPACGAGLQCPPAGLVLTADNYFGLFDGSTVVPLDPTASLLWRRVADENPDTHMTYGLAPLAQWQQDIIRDWISDGAPEWPAPER